MNQIAAETLALLQQRGETAACAESLTGGLVAATLTAVPGASAVVVGGVVTYATSLKRDLLGVTATSVISAECATQMAEGVRRITGADWGLATTGVAGPDRQEDQPVGTVFVAVAGPAQVVSRRLSLSGDRAAIRGGSVAGVLALLREQL